MALIVEAGVERNLGDGPIARSEFVLRVLDAHAPHVLAGRAAHMRAKRANDARGVHVRGARDIAERDALRGMLVNEVARQRKP